jgi:hypothetical protein
MQNWKLDPAEELKKKKAGEYDEAGNSCVRRRYDT